MDIVNMYKLIHPKMNDNNNFNDLLSRILILWTMNIYLPLMIVCCKYSLYILIPNTRDIVQIYTRAGKDRQP